MANHKSAAKRARQNEKRRVRNRTVASRVKTAVKAFRAAVAGGGDVDASLRAAERELRRAAGKGILPRRQASRRVSRLARQRDRAR